MDSSTAPFRCHLAVLYAGLEHGLGNNFVLADQFLNHAFRMAPKEPFVLHEMGVVAFQSRE